MCTSGNGGSGGSGAGTELSKHFLSIAPFLPHTSLMKCGHRLTTEDPDSLNILRKVTCLVSGRAGNGPEEGAAQSPYSEAQGLASCHWPSFLLSRTLVSHTQSQAQFPQNFLVS